MDNKLPLVSYCLLCYNQEGFIEDAINSALNQDYQNLEIIISDDHSNDRSFEIIQRIVSSYKGPHIIQINRNESNLGIVCHFNYVIENLVHGQYVALAAGDDVSFTNRVSKSITLMKENDLNTVAFNGEYINSGGSSLGRFIFGKQKGLDIYTLEDYIKRDKINIHGASRCFDINILDAFGPLNDNTPTEDTTLTLRGLLAGRVGCCYEPMIYYRSHGNNLSGIDSLMRMDYIAIANQYRTDINCLKDKMSDVQYMELMDRVDYYIKTSKLFRLNRNDIFNLRNLMALLSSPAFSFRGKLSIIKRAVHHKNKS